ncbi:adenine deaminase [Latilactobacillus sakei]|nr:adenine deaminase C-terminal domain-containing protein [Latilactobacillus sakei]AUX10969.1 adenine deaminase [Latilactobacillus sakei]
MIMSDRLTAFKELIQAGGAKRPADLIIKNGQLVNVMTAEIYPAEVAIYQGKIVAVDPDVSAYQGTVTRVIDAKQQYIVPGLIDGHIHVECSKLSMTSFAEAVVPHGTTSIISGLDEYISVIGVDGLSEIFKEVDQLPMRVFWGAPFKTPYTIPASTIADNIDSTVQAQLQKRSDVYGVWETVREAVETLDEDTLKTLLSAQDNHVPVWGCAPMATGTKLNEYLMSGVRVDHESYDHQELLEKVRKGINVVIRESSVTHFLAENIRAITETNGQIARHVSFCTDDVNAMDIVNKGHLDHLVRLAIAAGVAPMTAIQMATINSAEAYRIDDQVGLIAPGRNADILLVSDLEAFEITRVLAKGQPVATDGHIDQSIERPVRPASLANTVIRDAVQASDFEYHVAADASQVTVQTIASEGPFVRHAKSKTLAVEDGIVQIDPAKDVALISVLERFGKNGNQSLGFTSGWTLKKGAMASTAAPDDNNIIVMGVNPDDMALAVNTLIERDGGQVVVADGQILSFLPLPIAGIVSDVTPAELAVQEEGILKASQAIGSEVVDPMFYMTFLPITAIPDLAITDLGNVDCNELRLFDPILTIQ